jgi:hypothetical protein
MAKRGRTVREPLGRKVPAARKRAPADVDLKKEIAVLRRELNEALERQMATSEVLQAISNSPGELGPVFQSMVENATRVCGANFGVMNLWNGDTLNTVADYNAPTAFSASRENTLTRPHPESGHASTGNIGHFDNVRGARGDRVSNPE